MYVYSCTTVYSRIYSKCNRISEAFDLELANKLYMTLRTSTGRSGAGVAESADAGMGAVEAEVTESARACSYSSGKQAQKTCSGCERFGC